MSSYVKEMLWWQTLLGPALNCFVLLPNFISKPLNDHLIEAFCACQRIFLYYINDLIILGFKRTNETSRQNII